MRTGESESCGEVDEMMPISVIESRAPRPARSVPSAEQDTRLSPWLTAGSGSVFRRASLHTLQTC